MIKVNLNRKGKSTGGTGATALTGMMKGMLGKGGSGQGIGGIKEKIEQNSGIVKVIATLLFLNFISQFIDDFKAQEIKKVQSVISKVESEVTQIKTAASKFQDYSQKKAQLENDAKMLRQKLTVLSTVMEGRTVPARILIQISQVIPKNVWLSSFQLSNKDATFFGQSTSYEEVSEFLKAVQSSSYFSNVNLKNVEQKKVDQKLQNFSITANRRSEMQ